MSLGGGYQESNQRSDSSSGFQNTPYFGRAIDAAIKPFEMVGNLATRYAQSPFGFFQGKSVNDLVPTTNGLPNELMGFLSAATKQMYNKASAGGAMRGQVTPQSTGAVVGSALNNIAQFITPHVLDFKKYMVGLPDTLMNSRLGFLQNTLGAQAPLVGSRSSYSGSSMGVNAFGGKGKE